MPTKKVQSKTNPEPEMIRVPKTLPKGVTLEYNEKHGEWIYGAKTKDGLNNLLELIWSKGTH